MRAKSFAQPDSIVRYKKRSGADDDEDADADAAPEPAAQESPMGYYYTLPKAEREALVVYARTTRKARRTEDWADHEEVTEF